MSWKDLLIVRVTEQNALDVQAGFPILLFVATVLILRAIWCYRKSSHWDVVEATLSIGNTGTVKIKPSYVVIQIAHKAWVELMTRKAGLPLDEENDVIVEIYDSWYALFSEMRNLAREVPAEKIRQNSDTRMLIRLIIDSLNLGLRPHLTKWQAKFRRWYSEEEKKYPELSPQQIQRKYGHYNELIGELKAMNQQLMEYAAFLKDIAHGRLSA